MSEKTKACKGEKLVLLKNGENHLFVIEEITCIGFWARDLGTVNEADK